MCVVSRPCLWRLEDSLQESILSYRVGSGLEELIPTEPSRRFITIFCYYLFIVYMCVHANHDTPVQVRSQLAESGLTFHWGVAGV